MKTWIFSNNMIMTKIKINVNLSEMCNWRLTFWMSSRLWKRRVVILQVNKKIERAGGWWGRCWIWNQCIGISESSRLIKHNWHSLPNSVVTLHLSTLLCPSQLSLSRFSKSQLTLAKSYESFLSGISIKQQNAHMWYFQPFSWHISSFISNDS